MMKNEMRARKRDGVDRKGLGTSPGERKFRKILEEAYEAAVQGTAGNLKIHFDDAREAVHAVIAGLLEARKRGRGRRPIRKPGAFLKKSAVGAHQRSRGENDRLVLLCELAPDERRELVEETPGPGPDPATDTADREIERRAWRELSTLPGRQRKAVSLRCSKLAYREISRILGITPGNARVHYHAGIQVLRRRLGVAA